MSGEIPESHTTLLVRHIPIEFSEENTLEFLKHFGASTIHSLPVGSKKNGIVFATFESPAAARAALLRMHQFEVMGHRLCVEYAHANSSSSKEASSSTKTLRNDVKPEEDKRQRLQDQLMRRLVAWSSKLNLSQPPPNHLRYQYPPPNPATLANIGRALANHPRLYTQVLHLMNRMNLPPPFQNTNHSGNSCDQMVQTDLVWVNKSSSESELESDEEDNIITTDALPLKRPFAQKNSKLIKRPKFIKPTPVLESTVQSQPALRPEEVFEMVETDVSQKKIELRLDVSIPAEQKAAEPGVQQAEQVEGGGFGVIAPVNKTSVEENDKEELGLEGDGSVITAEQLASNRIPAKDLSVVAVFKNYNAGTPSCRLYIKNVSKHAAAKDLHYIYRRYLPAEDISDESTNMFDIRLMTEGRMKGQAFITLPSVDLAQQAVNETNGYILKDKPLVVQFARSAPAAVGPK